MTKSIIIILLICLLSPGYSLPGRETSKDRVTIDFGMVEKGIEWLEYIKTEADDLAAKNYFMTRVAPTHGCQAIIHHWARFRNWNEEIFYEFIMTALGRIPTDKKFQNEDGSLTMLGIRQMLWATALKNTDILNKHLNSLKKSDIGKSSLKLAKKYLPDAAVLEADFYFVFFGHSTAFSVGKENGFDFLQLPLKNDGTLEMDNLIDIFAHEMHHTGFDYLQKLKIKHIANDEKVQLLGLLAAEGMPTYFIDQPGNRLNQYRARKDPIYKQVADDWEKHAARINELYQEADKDIAANLENKITQKEITERWMSGAKGAAYVLGADMIAKIDKYLGRKAAVAIASDIRQFIPVYNRAARTAAARGEKIFFFNENLSTRIASFKGK